MKHKKEKEEIKKRGYVEVNPNDVQLISEMQESGEYFLDLAPDQNRKWIIRKNPNHFTWWKRELVAGFIGAVLALTGQYIIIKLQSQSIKQESKTGNAKTIQTFDTSTRLTNQKIFP